MLVDIHQHVWTEPLVDALEHRDRLPFIRREGDHCMVHLVGETPSGIDLAGERRAARHALLHRDGIDRALIALSSPLGIEALPRREARSLIDAHLAGVAALGPAFGAWGPLALEDACAADVDRLLEGSCVGISLPAGACASPRALESLHAVLDRVEEIGVPLFIHPGPGRGEHLPESSLADPLWWPAMTRYVAQMHAAWLSLAVLARRRHPRLRLVFAMLAGGAPLQVERLRARAGAVEIAGEQTFYDTSSYGPAAIAAMSACVGEDQLVYGSDRPVVEPAPGESARALAANAERLATPWVLAA